MKTFTPDINDAIPIGTVINPPNPIIALILFFLINLRIVNILEIIFIDEKILLNKDLPLTPSMLISLYSKSKPLSAFFSI